uniref:Transmembrane emp24 domain-containing protein 10 n=1 Tax=Rhizophora mucronata TaxID=61149 RepID=A0A2P2QMC0_RHIMU
MIATRLLQLSVVVITATIWVLSSTSESLRFDLESGRTKCISEDIKSGALTVGKYDVLNPNEGHPLPDSQKLTVKVTSSYGNVYHEAEKVGTGNFAFTAPEKGDYMACFFAEEHKPPITLTVEFEWRSGMAAKDWSNVAKKGSVEVMELELKKMYDNVMAIQEEMYYLREREEEMQDLNRSTNSRMGWLSFLSLLVCLSVAGLQVWHLRTFFQKKKLI